MLGIFALATGTGPATGFKTASDDVERIAILFFAASQFVVLKRDDAHAPRRFLFDKDEREGWLVDTENALGTFANQSALLVIAAVGNGALDILPENACGGFQIDEIDAGCRYRVGAYLHSQLRLLVFPESGALDLPVKSASGNDGMLR